MIAVVYVHLLHAASDDVFPTSIDSTWAYFSHWAKRAALLAVGLLPVYVSFNGFGTAAMGVYVSFCNSTAGMRLNLDGRAANIQIFNHTSH